MNSLGLVAIRPPQKNWLIEKDMKNITFLVRLLPDFVFMVPLKISIITTNLFSVGFAQVS